MRSPPAGPCALLLSAAALGACRPRLCPDLQALPDSPRIQAIGDSILAWGGRSCSSVAAQVGLHMGTDVLPGAINGAHLLRGGDTPIPEQYVPGTWEWVLVDGGANDLEDGCSCDVGCGEILDRLSSPDGTTGAMPALIDRLVQDEGVGRVGLIGYYLLPDGAWYGLDDCRDEITELNARYAALAARHPEVLSLPLAEEIDWQDDRDAYDVDRVHPSPAGARQIGAWIAARLRAAGP